MAHVDKDYLLGGHRCVSLAEIDAVFKSHVVFGVAPALLVIDEIVYQCVVVVVTFHHNTVEIFEVVVAVYGIRDKHDTFLCRCFYQKAVIWDVVGRFKGLDGKSTDECLLSRRKRLYALNRAFFEQFFVDFLAKEHMNASADELFCGGFVEMVGVPWFYSPVRGDTAPHRCKVLHI